MSSMENLETSKNTFSLESILEEMKKRNRDCGAIGIFVGFVKGFNRGKKVLRLEYEKFDELFNLKIKEIENKIREHPGVSDVFIFHKSGTLKPGEDIMYVIVVGKSRNDVWKPLKECVELIKKELPIWKKEIYDNGAVWVHDVEK